MTGLKQEVLCLRDQNNQRYYSNTFLAVVGQVENMFRLKINLIVFNPSYGLNRVAFNITTLFLKLFMG